MCAALLPPGDNPIAVNKYIKSIVHFYYPTNALNYVKLRD